MASATTGLRLNPKMTFVYVSGAGTDASEIGRAVWASCCDSVWRSYMLRPGLIQPGDGVRCRTVSCRPLYALARPILPVMHQRFPNAILTTAKLGKGMPILVRDGALNVAAESADIRSILSSIPRA
jgi:hypothetical protein